MERATHTIDRILSGEPPFQYIHFTFLETLKTLDISGCHLQWSDMSKIQSLPNLESLKLQQNAFVGSCWDTDEQEFQKLKMLSLCWLDIRVW